MFSFQGVVRSLSSFFHSSSPSPSKRPHVSGTSRSAQLTAIEAVKTLESVGRIVLKMSHLHWGFLFQLQPCYLPFQQVNRGMSLLSLRLEDEMLSQQLTISIVTMLFIKNYGWSHHQLFQWVNEMFVKAKAKNAASNWNRKTSLLWGSLLITGS